jgi:hypothetical protein
LAISVGVGVAVVDVVKAVFAEAGMSALAIANVLTSWRRTDREAA